MKTIDVYVCDCGEEMYIDDIECANCGAPMDSKKLKPKPLIQITHVGETECVDAGSIGKRKE